MTGLVEETPRRSRRQVELFSPWPIEEVHARLVQDSPWAARFLLARFGGSQDGDTVKIVSRGLGAPVLPTHSVVLAPHPSGTTIDVTAGSQLRLVAWLVGSFVALALVLAGGPGLVEVIAGELGPTDFLMPLAGLTMALAVWSAFVLGATAASDRRNFRRATEMIEEAVDGSGSHHLY